MALTNTDINEIEKIVKKEIKSFLDSKTLKQLEEKMIELLLNDIKRGKSEKEIKNIISNSMMEFYEYLWFNKSTWMAKIKK
jgi:hypothetical protein